MADDDNKEKAHTAFAVRREGKKFFRWLEIGNARYDAHGGVAHVLLDRLPIGGFHGNVYCRRRASNRRRPRATMEGEVIPMANPDNEIDWTRCELVERVPGKVSGQPIVRGTRIMPGSIVRSYDRGESIEDIREGWPSLSVDQIKALIAFAHAQRGQPAP